MRVQKATGSTRWETIMRGSLQHTASYFIYIRTKLGKLTNAQLQESGGD